MIYGLKGLVTTITLNTIVLNVHDVHYELQMANIDQLTVGQDVFLYTHQVIRDDEHLLIGFATLEEKKLFNSLIKVSGIGPKTALGILTSTRPERFNEAIMNEELAYLKKLPGVGPKGASQIILDLRGKLQTNLAKGTNLKQQEVIQGLLSLGFKKADVTSVVTKIYDESLSANDLLKRALSEFRSK